MNTRDNTDHFDLYEVEEYDPLDGDREQGCSDPFWTFPSPTIEDWASLADIT